MDLQLTEMNNDELILKWSRWIIHAASLE